MSLTTSVHAEAEVTWLLTGLEVGASGFPVRLYAVWAAVGSLFRTDGHVCVMMHLIGDQRVRPLP